MKPECIICRKKALYLLTKDSYDLFRCSRCGLIFVHPLPSFNALKAVYSKITGYQSGKSRQLDKVAEHPNNVKVLGYLGRHKIKGRLLDVGCSNGEFMFSAKKRGFQVFGVELNPLTAKIAQKNKLDVFMGTLDQAKFKKDYFDVIFLGDVIEHMSDPKGLLRECHKLLKKNGLLIVITPNLDGFWAKTTYWLFRVLRIPWSSVTPPYHLFHFSVTNLKKFLKLSEYEPTEVWYNPPPPLSYELWFNGSAKKYSETKGLKNFLEYYYVYFIYALFYLLNKQIYKILGKDNSMVIVSRKK
jgi:SAM-dependent methyltransferase